MHHMSLQVPAGCRCTAMHTGQASWSPTESRPAAGPAMHHKAVLIPASCGCTAMHTRQTGLSVTY